MVNIILPPDVFTVKIPLAVLGKMTLTTVSSVEKRNFINNLKQLLDIRIPFSNK